MPSHAAALQFTCIKKWFRWMRGGNTPRAPQAGPPGGGDFPASPRSRVSPHFGDCTAHRMPRQIRFFPGANHCYVAIRLAVIPRSTRTTPLLASRLQMRSNISTRVLTTPSASSAFSYRSIATAIPRRSAPVQASTCAPTSRSASLVSTRASAPRSLASFQTTVRGFATTMSAADKIKVQNPVVEMDGDEMTVSARNESLLRCHSNN